MNKIIFILFCMLLGCKVSWAGPTGLIDKGKELYLSYGCVVCHGLQGRGNGMNSRKFIPPPTNFHDLKAYLHGSDHDSIRRSIQYGIKEENSIMPAFQDIPPEEIDLIIDYLQSLQKKDK